MDALDCKTADCLLEGLLYTLKYDFPTAKGEVVHVFAYKFLKSILVWLLGNDVPVFVRVDLVYFAECSLYGVLIYFPVDREFFVNALHPL
jgi:hypothetical protein